MSRHRISPAILAALGLAACTDGCHPSDLPIVGTLFDDAERDAADGTEPVHVCLTVARPPPVQACLSPTDELPQPRVGPCLSRPPSPPSGQICLSPIPVDGELGRPQGDDGARHEIDAREDVVARIAAEASLPMDVLARLERDT